jgi:hypothetical protein
MLHKELPEYRHKLIHKIETKFIENGLKCEPTKQLRDMDDWELLDYYSEVKKYFDLAIDATFNYLNVQWDDDKVVITKLYDPYAQLQEMAKTQEKKVTKKPRKKKEAEVQ